MSKNETKIIAEPGKQEVFIIREFDAPRELVFKAHTDPELFAQWIGPHGMATNLEAFEPVSGGKYRFVQTAPDGNEYAFRGVFHEVTASERVIQTFEYEGLPESGHVSLETMVLEELPGNRTRMRAQSVFQTGADRDGMIESGMEQGVNEGYERLDAILAEVVETAV